MPRSSTYHLLAAMTDEGFVIHYPDDRTWGIGIAAWEVGHGFARQEPLARLARLPLARLVDQVGQSAHLVRAARCRRPLRHRGAGSRPTAAGHRRRRTSAGSPHRLGSRDPGLAAGRPGTSALPRQGCVHLSYGRRTQDAERASPAPRRRPASAGYATEDGEVTPGFASIAAPITAGTIHAAVAVTWEARTPVDGLAEPVAATAAEISRRLHH